MNLIVVRAWREVGWQREMASYCLMGSVSVLQDEKVLEMAGSDGCTTI